VLKAMIFSIKCFAGLESRLMLWRTLEDIENPGDEMSLSFIMISERVDSFSDNTETICNI
jgi:hypothetical protein